MTVSKVCGSVAKNHLGSRNRRLEGRGVELRFLIMTSARWFQKYQDALAPRSENPGVVGTGLMGHRISSVN